MMDTNAKIFVAGHRGLFGSGILRHLKKHGYANIITRTRQELDLTDQAAVNAFFAKEKPDYVFLAAAKVGGIFANMADPLGFVRDNIMIQSNVLDSAHRHGVKRFLFLGSSCLLPRLCPQPMNEEAFMTGPIEPTNLSYAVAKIAGLQTCTAHNAALAKTGEGMECRAIVPPNLYGEGDHFDANGHALAGLMHRMHHAKMKGEAEFTVWGTGKPMREWMHVDDAADAAVFAMNSAVWNSEVPFLNTGCGVEFSMTELAREIQKVIGYKGELMFDSSKPDGMPRKLLDSTRFLKLGWTPSVSFNDGLKRTYAYYLTLPNSQPDKAAA